MTMVTNVSALLAGLVSYFALGCVLDASDDNQGIESLNFNYHYYFGTLLLAVKASLSQDN